MSTKIKTSILLSFIILMSCLCACGRNDKAFSKSGMYFDTVVSVTVYCDEAVSDKMLDECMSICEHYEQLFDKNIPGSDIANINASTGPVSVDHDTALMLSKAASYYKMTNGRFDISIEPVSRLWDFHNETGIIPDEKDLKEACQHVGFDQITVDTENNTVTVDGSCSIDPGAIAKGFIADKIADHLSGLSITGAIINMGGDMHVIGTKPDGSDFLIGINDPFSEGGVVSALALHDISIATSGTYERFFIKDGKKYHHILDTRTGYPVETDIESVTVITKDSIDCDCLCTVCIITGSRKALDIIEQLSDTEAVFVLSDGSMMSSSGAGKYIRQ